MNKLNITYVRCTSRYNIKRGDAKLRLLAGSSASIKTQARRRRRLISNITYFHQHVHISQYLNLKLHFKTGKIHNSRPGHSSIALIPPLRKYTHTCFYNFVSAHNEWKIKLWGAFAESPTCRRRNSFRTRRANPTYNSFNTHPHLVQLLA